MKTTKNTAQIGTVSHGTMRPQDLIPCFLEELGARQVNLSKFALKFRELQSEADAFLHKLHVWGVILDDNDPWWDSEESAQMLEALFDALGELAPPYCYFGSHPGDGCDYGFWPDLEEIDGRSWDDELIKVSDLSEVPEDYCGDVCIVNDHGNMTIGFVDDSGSFVASWAIV
jgi:hypothetical protein